MAIDERLFTMPAQWAKGAQTNIPNPPVPGIAYRNIDLTAADIESGQAYDKVYDSARYNQLDFITSGLAQGMEQYGILPWSSLTNYQKSGICMGLDGFLYQALQPSGPASGGAQGTTNRSYWKLYQPLMILTEDTNFYVSPGGNDNNSGLSDTDAWLTPTYAAKWINDNVTLNGFTAIVNIANGTYNLEEPIRVLKPESGIGYRDVIVDTTSTSCVKFVGESKTGVFLSSANNQDVVTVIRSHFEIHNVTFVVNVTNTSTGSVSNALSILYASSGVVIDCDLTLNGTAATATFARGFRAAFGSALSIAGTNMTVRGYGGWSFLLSIQLGYINISVSTLTFTGQTFTNCTALSQNLGFIWWLIPSSSGSVTGIKFQVSNSATIGMNGQSPNVIPGSVAGVAIAASGGFVA